MKRALLIAAAALAFLAISVGVARWLSTDSTERGAVVDLLRAQARGDAHAMLRSLRCPDARCAALARANAARLRTPGEVKIVRYDSHTAHALTTKTDPTRVVWAAPGRLPTVQCVLVRRRGGPISGVSVTLLRLSAPIGRQSSCR
ncbi:MAG: hypothetical protein M3296_08825 [Actinomycetota bacterium]|nr:hypothetical protein [Actinomycetota bacterium]